MCFCHLGDIFGVILGLWKHLGTPGASFAAWGEEVAKNDRKMGSIWEAWGSWCSPWVHSVSLLQPRSAKRAAMSVKKDEFGSILEIVIFLCVFDVFRG